MLAITTIIIFLQVLFRYVLTQPLSWTEETARFLFIWVALLRNRVRHQTELIRQKMMKEAALEERIGQLEQALGKAHLENEFLKKALHQSFDQSRKKGSSLPTTETLSKPSRGGANS